MLTAKGGERLLRGIRRREEEEDACLDRFSSFLEKNLSVCEDFNALIGIRTGKKNRAMCYFHATKAEHAIGIAQKKRGLGERKREN